MLAGVREVQAGGLGMRHDAEPVSIGARDRDRTGDPQLGKSAKLDAIRKCSRIVSNRPCGRFIAVRRQALRERAGVRAIPAPRRWT